MDIQWWAFNRTYLARSLIHSDDGSCSCYPDSIVVEGKVNNFQLTARSIVMSFCFSIARANSTGEFSFWLEGHSIDCVSQSLFVWSTIQIFEKRTWIHIKIDYFLKDICFGTSSISFQIVGWSENGVENIGQSLWTIKDWVADLFMSMTMTDSFPFAVDEQVAKFWVRTEVKENISRRTVWAGLNCSSPMLDIYFLWMPGFQVEPDLLLFPYLATRFASHEAYLFPYFPLRIEWAEQEFHVPRCCCQCKSLDDSVCFLLYRNIWEDLANDF